MVDYGQKWTVPLNVFVSFLPFFEVTRAIELEPVLYFSETGAEYDKIFGNFYQFNQALAS